MSFYSSNQKYDIFTLRSAPTPNVNLYAPTSSFSSSKQSGVTTEDFVQASSLNCNLAIFGKTKQMHQDFKCTLSRTGISFDYNPQIYDAIYNANITANFVFLKCTGVYVHTMPNVSLQAHARSGGF